MRGIWRRTCTRSCSTSVSIYREPSAVKRADREARLERAKAIGRVAYRLARDAKISGFIEIEGERKLVRDFESDDDFLQLRYVGQKVFQVRWSKAGSFKIVTFESGDWERILHT